MKNVKVTVIFAILAAFVFAFAGCGSGGDSSEQTAQTQTSAPPAVSETVEQEISAQVAEAADTNMTVDEFVGSWVGVDDETLFVNISKEGDQYVYEDNDAKYPGTYADGILKITVAENDFADVYVDKDTGNLVLTYQDNIIRYKRK